MAQGRYPDLLPSSSTAWAAVTTARSAAPSSLGHDEKDKDRQHHVSLERGRANMVAKGMHAMLGKIVGLRLRHPAKSGGVREKGKEKENDRAPASPMSRSNSAHPSISFYHSGTPSSISRSSSLSIRGREGVNEMWKGSALGTNKRSSFSCCSVSLFGEDDVSRLGSHVGGFMMR